MELRKKRNKTAETLTFIYIIIIFAVDIKNKIWRNYIGGSGKNLNWREEILAVEEKFHFWRKEISSLKVCTSIPLARLNLQYTSVSVITPPSSYKK